MTTTTTFLFTTSPPASGIFGDEFDRKHGRRVGRLAPPLGVDPGAPISGSVTVEGEGLDAVILAMHILAATTDCAAATLEEVTS